MWERKLFALVFLFGGVTLLFIGFRITWAPRGNFDWMAPNLVSTFMASDSRMPAAKVVPRATTMSDDAAALVASLTRNPEGTSAVAKTSDFMGGKLTSSGLESLVTSTEETASSLPKSFHNSSMYSTPAVSLPASPTDDPILRYSPEPGRKIGSPPEGGRLLCCTLMGRLGNEMYQYASVLGIAYKTSRTPVLVAGQHLRSTLQHPPPGDNLQGFSDRCRTSVYIVERACCFFDERLVNLDAGKDAKIGMYLQSWRYFKDYDSQIRQAMTFNAEVTMAANRTVRALRAKSRRIVVGVHVRRGDYLVKKHVEMGYKAASAEYLKRAMTYFRERLGQVTFVVSSDDEHWFKTYVSQDNDVVILNRQAPAVDMLVLASMDHVIITVGTYGWWVGFLNKGIVVHQKDFIAHNTEIGNQFGANGSDYIYPGWIPL